MARLRIPQRRDGVCEVCFGLIDDRYRTCFKCNSFSYDDPVDSVQPFFYYPKSNKSMGDLLYGYKDSNRHNNLQSFELMTQIWKELIVPHLGCMAYANDIGRISVVPSTSNPPREHLDQIVKSEYPDHFLNIVAEVGAEKRKYIPESFWPTSTVNGGVILIDDTWVSGMRARSTAAALKRAGAASVHVVTFARLIDDSNSLGKEFVSHALDQLPLLEEECPWSSCQNA